MARAVQHARRRASSASAGVAGGGGGGAAAARFFPAPAPSGRRMLGSTSAQRRSCSCCSPAAPPWSSVLTSREYLVSVRFAFLWRSRLQRVSAAAAEVSRRRQQLGLRPTEEVVEPCMIGHVRSGALLAGVEPLRSPKQRNLVGSAQMPAIECCSDRHAVVASGIGQHALQQALHIWRASPRLRELCRLATLVCRVGHRLLCTRGLGQGPKGLGKH